MLHRTGCSRSAQHLYRPHDRCADNAAHWECMPLGLFGYGVFGGSASALDVGLIWLSHVAFDRMIGAGLKYRGGFQFSHLGVRGATDPAQGPGPLDVSGQVR
ncbi:DUF4260 family protein [Sulfitobacter sp. 20_GPM-1509m]|uniref:DUF4260 family protein n=1 Tax=Sulfitobacter sp. 20_GPM-1509m TaxID=1380367 RepID=UPI0026732702|nr:DUF4260 family protein [Sulfitobacter sp. 20_GPM-1509m]